MSAEDHNIGRMVAGRYRLDELLGRGGFGSVYRGWDTQIARDVAVKLLDVAQGDRSPDGLAELRERFRREAMAAGRINHRCVVTIYDFGVPEDGTEAYIVMEYLKGHDLAEELDTRGPLMPDRAMKMLVPMLEALGRGHDLGIVHKDIKPQNIFIRDPGTMNESMCLVDFGVARVIHEDKLTMTGLIVGTPQYLAPEYITETIVTPKLDVYQMGLIIAETITGVPAVPLGETFVKSCNRHFTGDLDIPDSLMEGPLGDVLGAALQPNPDERIGDATEMCRRLASVDPRTIAVDFQETMVFQRNPASRRTTEGELPMFPPMNPEQVSQELERQERDPSAAFAKSDTPVSVAGPASGAMRAVDGLGSEASDTMWPSEQKVPVRFGSNPSIKVPPANQGSSPSLQIPPPHEGSNPAIRVDSSHGSNPAIRVDSSHGSNPAIRVPPPQQHGSNPAVQVPPSGPNQGLHSPQQNQQEAGGNWEWGGPPPAGQAQSLSEATSADPSSGSSGALLILMMVVMLALVVGAGVFAFMLLPENSGEEAAEVPPVVEEPAETPPAEPEVEVEPIVEAKRIMEIDSVPSGAKLVVDGAGDLTTPAKVELDKLEASTARLQLDGYEEVEIELTEGTKTIELKKSRSAKRTKERPSKEAARRRVETKPPPTSDESELDDVKRLNLSEVAAQGAANIEAEGGVDEADEVVEETETPEETPEEPAEEPVEEKTAPAKWQQKGDGL